MQPAIDASGNLTYTPAANANGTATVSLKVDDDGGNANGGDNSTTQTFTLNVTAVNDAPTLSLSTASDTVLEDSGLRTISSFATIAQGGGADENSQTLTRTVTTNNDALFAVGPAIDASGNLTYTPAANANGIATVTVKLEDDGGTLNGGVDEVTETFSIVVNAVADAPTLTGAGSSLLTDNGSNNFTANNQFTAIDEDNTTSSGDSVLTFLNAASVSDPEQSAISQLGIAVTSVDDAKGNWEFSLDNGSNFTDFGAVSASTARLLDLTANHKIRFVPELDFQGTATIKFRAWDGTTGSSGGTATTSTNGGTSAFSAGEVTKTITINPINDEPRVSVTNQAFNEDAGTKNITSFATPTSGATQGENAQTFTFNLSNDNPGLFAVAPAIASNGTLTFRTNDNAHGTATVNVDVVDLSLIHI